MTLLLGVTALVWLVGTLLGASGTDSSRPSDVPSEGARVRLVAAPGGGSTGGSVSDQDQPATAGTTPKSTVKPDQSSGHTADQPVHKATGTTPARGRDADQRDDQAAAGAHQVNRERGGQGARTGTDRDATVVATESRPRDPRDPTAEQEALASPRLDANLRPGQAAHGRQSARRDTASDTCADGCPAGNPLHLRIDNPRGDGTPNGGIGYLNNHLNSHLNRRDDGDPTPAEVPGQPPGTPPAPGGPSSAQAGTSGAGGAGHSDPSAIPAVRASQARFGLPGNATDQPGSVTNPGGSPLGARAPPATTSVNNSPHDDTELTPTVRLVSHTQDTVPGDGVEVNCPNGCNIQIKPKPASSDAPSDDGRHYDAAPGENVVLHDPATVRANGRNINLTGGAGNNRDIRVTGDHNTVTLGNGDDNDVTVQGSHNKVRLGNGSNNQVTAGDGDDNDLSVGKGNNNEVSAGNGNHNRVTTGPGDHNQALAGDGDNTRVIAGAGNDNRAEAGDGNKHLVIAGFGSNNVALTGRGDHNRVTTGAGSGNQALGGGGDHNRVTAGRGDHNTAFAGPGDDNRVTTGAGSNNQAVAGGGDHNTAIAGGPGSNNTAAVGPGNHNRAITGEGDHNLAVTGPGDGNLTRTGPGNDNATHTGPGVGNRAQVGSGQDNTANGHPVAPNNYRSFTPQDEPAPAAPPVDTNPSVQQQPGQQPVQQPGHAAPGEDQRLLAPWVKPVESGAQNFLGKFHRYQRTLRDATTRHLVASDQYSNLGSSLRASRLPGSNAVAGLADRYSQYRLGRAQRYGAMSDRLGDITKLKLRKGGLHGHLPVDGNDPSRVGLRRLIPTQRLLSATLADRFNRLPKVNGKPAVNPRIVNSPPVLDNPTLPVATNIDRIGGLNLAETVRRGLTKVSAPVTLAFGALDVYEQIKAGKPAGEAVGKTASGILVSGAASALATAGVAALVPGPGWAVAGGIVVGLGASYAWDKLGGSELGAKIGDGVAHTATSAWNGAKKFFGF